jgi:hypothetical protein
VPRHEAVLLMHDNSVKWRRKLSPQLRLVCWNGSGSYVY